MHTSPLSICIIRISSMGDIVLVSPLLRQLRSRYPDAQIDMVVAERFTELVENNPHLSAIHALDTESGIFGILRQSRQIEFGVKSGSYSRHRLTLPHLASSELN